MNVSMVSTLKKLFDLPVLALSRIPKGAMSFMNESIL